MMVMCLLLPVTTTAPCVIQPYLNPSVELMNLPISHPAEQPARNTIIIDKVWHMPERNYWYSNLINYNCTGFLL